jgi:hypothetical protein
MDLQLSEDPDALLVEQAQALDAALRDVAAHRGPPPCYQIVWRVRRHSTVICRPVLMVQSAPNYGKEDSLGAPEAPSSRSTPVIPDSGVAPKITTTFPDTRRLRRGSR